MLSKLDSFDFAKEYYKNIIEIFNKEDFFLMNIKSLKIWSKFLFVGLSYNINEIFI